MHSKRDGTLCAAPFLEAQIIQSRITSQRSDGTDDRRHWTSWTGFGNQNACLKSALNPCAARIGDADDFLDRSRLVTKAPAVLVRTHPAQRLPDAALAIILQIRIELRHELVGTDARPVPEIEEPVPQPPEEAPRTRRCRGRSPWLTCSWPSRPPHISVSTRTIGNARHGRSGSWSPRRLTGRAARAKTAFADSLWSVWIFDVPC